MTQRRPSSRSLRRLLGAAFAAALLAALLPGAAAASVARAPLTDGGATLAAPAPADIQLTPVANLAQPVLAIGARDGSGRLFIVQKTGRIRIVKNGNLLAASFLNISTSVSGGSEQGLLGLAFHPSFTTNRKFYVNYTNLAGNTVIKEYLASASNPDVVQTGSGRTLLTITQPYSNHNGGMVAFGPDGYLYIGMGDGGSGGDPGNRAQNINNALGKMLRINVNGSTATKRYISPKTNPYFGKPGLDEIWERGLRNPWRFSFDRLTGSLWIADVGQERYEEVNRAGRPSPTTAAGRGLNFGWRVMEGRHCYRPASGCSTSGKTLPMLEYSHASNGRCSITGGYVYRGSAIPSLYGQYVYGDYCSGEVWAVAVGATAPATPTRLIGTGTGRLVSGFGQGDGGELYLCDLGGTVYRIDPN